MAECLSREQANATCAGEAELRQRARAAGEGDMSNGRSHSGGVEEGNMEVSSMQTLRRK
jgi:hypothetical protein